MFLIPPLTVFFLPSPPPPRAGEAPGGWCVLEGDGPKRSFPYLAGLRGPRSLGQLSFAFLLFQTSGLEVLFSSTLTLFPGTKTLLCRKSDSLPRVTPSKPRRMCQGVKPREGKECARSHTVKRWPAWDQSPDIGSFAGSPCLKPRCRILPALVPVQRETLPNTPRPQGSPMAQE